MCKKSNDIRQEQNGASQTSCAIKDWVLFFGELVKASVDGVVEFWSKEEEPSVPTEEPIVAEFEEICEEELCEDVCEEIEEIVPTGPTAKELKQEMKRVRREEKQAKKEQKRAEKAEKKEAKNLKKEEDRINSAEKKLAKAEKKAEKKLAKKEKKAGYVSKDVVLTSTEKQFFDGIKFAVGLRYIVKPRVALSSVLKKENGETCKDEQLGEMDFGVFDLQNRLKVLIEVKGIKRRGKQSKKVYKRARKLCKKADIPVVTFWAKYGVLNDYIKERMQDYLSIL